CVKKEDDFDYW
nr:immunoglobulin heavy chain junction region [Macaca mulatta]MOV86987.1 immunoglobulin heavy chain junction region [Macaca mulatta]MOV87573.1 immunoglobulin heavy chain junction region [Macaca mulatta]MOV87756.1 immunoglobulin heavy chain junction region [Macaca mulatta]MOV88028.1 immunoglobulin heavy chain junction region [Macaca mulatta]